jgi:ribosomal protein L7Ae-like RNA K-turn-binding protein
MKPKIESYLGFAARSGNLVAGTDTCRKRMEKGAIKMVLLAEDLSKNTRDKVIRTAIKTHTPYREFGTKQWLSKITGEEESGVFGITDDHFYQVILKELEKKEGRI